MSIITTTATYKRGVIIPKFKPNYAPEKIIVLFIKPEKNLEFKNYSIFLENILAKNTENKKNNKEKILKIVKNSFGSWGQGVAGIEYENKIRTEAESHFKNL